MIDFKRILFPVDFSAQSKPAAPFVRAMARCFDSEIVVLHVIEGLHPSGESGSAGGDGAEAEIALDGFAAEEFAGVPVKRRIATGDVAKQIAECAEKERAGLIMIPTHGYGPFRTLLLGSVTAKVLHDVPCPVWTGVHAEQMTSHSPDRWKRLLCAVDTDEHGEAVLRWAWEFAQQQKLELELVHAVAGADGMWTAENDPSMHDFLFHAAQEQLVKLQSRAGTNSRVRLMGGSAGTAVRSAALDYNADLVVIGRGAIQTPLGRLRNNGYSIIRAAPCPVISI